MVDLDRLASLRDRPDIGARHRPVSAAPGASEELVPSVLIIDDDKEIHRLLRARLEARGCQVSAASSGEEGISKLREVNPDLVFLDVAMSGMTGIDVLDVVRSRRLDVAVILTTAYSSEQVAIAARRPDTVQRKPPIGA